MSGRVAEGGQEGCGRRLGKIGNCQVGVFLAYAGARGHTLLDRELYLPAAWTDDPARLAGAELAPDTPFATKPQLAQRMLARVRDAGLPVVWVTGDTVYGRATDLRRWLEDRGQHHVLAVPRNESLWVGRDIWTPVAVHAVHAAGSGIGSAPARAVRANVGTTGSAGCRPRPGRSWPGRIGVVVISGWRSVATIAAGNHNQLTYNCSIRSWRS